MKLLDLGIVRTVDGDPLTAGSISHVVLGTADYLAPEQAVDSSAVDARADVYSMGATLYFLLAGHPPFPNGTIAEKLSWKQSFDPPNLDNLRSDVPPKLTAIVSRMMARRPTDRYLNPLAASEALAECAGAVADFPSAVMNSSDQTLESGATVVLNDGERGRHDSDALRQEFTASPPTLPTDIDRPAQPPDLV